MANPATLAAVGAGTQLAGTAVGAFGNYFTGKAQSNQYNYQAGVALVDRNLKLQDANYAIAVGGVEEQRTGLMGREKVGAERVGFGAGNIDSTTGSPSKVISSQIEVNQQNEGIVTARAAKTAYNYDVAAAEDTSTAQGYGIAAKTARFSSGLNMASTFLGGAGSVASKWMQYQPAFGSGDSGSSDTDPTKIGSLY